MFDPVQELQRLIMDGGEQAFDLVPKYVAIVLDQRLWTTRKTRGGEPFTSFAQFAAARRPEGLGTPIDPDLMMFCRRNKKVTELLIEAYPLAAHGGDGGDSKVIIEPSNRGTTLTYTLRRLKRDRPDLFHQVMEGKLTANSAAIEAGHRKPPPPLKILLRTWRIATPQDRAEFFMQI